ncbi:MAG: hypothetical protein ACKV2Q_08050 [Planctomycetaceae bacterium]
MMETTLSRPKIAGFTSEVEQFADEHGITEIVYAMYEAAWRLFPMAGQIRVQLGEDYEDSSWRHIDFEIEQLTITETEAYLLDRRWLVEVYSHCPAEHAWLFTHRLSFAE